MALLNLKGRRLYLLMKITCGTSFMMYGCACKPSIANTISGVQEMA